jgi:YafQ family addiction module toxin component
MKALRVTEQYQKDLRSIAGRGYRIKKLVAIVQRLQKGLPVPATDDDHPLKEPWEAYRGCNIQRDWVLIYQTNEQQVVLVRTGTYADLFE